MQNKNPLSYTKTETASQAVNKQTSELLQKDFRNVQVNIENTTTLKKLGSVQIIGNNMQQRIIVNN